MTCNFTRPRLGLCPVTHPVTKGQALSTKSLLPSSRVTINILAIFALIASLIEPCIPSLELTLNVISETFEAGDPDLYRTLYRVHLQTVHLRLLVAILRHLDQLPIDWPEAIRTFDQELRGLNERNPNTN